MDREDLDRNNLRRLRNQGIEAFMDDDDLDFQVRPMRARRIPMNNIGTIRERPYGIPASNISSRTGLSSIIDEKFSIRRTNPQNPLTTKIPLGSPKGSTITSMSNKRLGTKQSRRENPEKKQKKEKKPPKKEINKDFKFKGDLQIANDLLPENDLKNLRRLCANLVETAENILIKYSVTKPTILFEYSDKEERKTIHFRDIMKGNREKKIPVEPALIFRTFDRLYQQVPEDYWLVGQFGIVQAKQKNFYKFKNLKISKDMDKLRLYYGTGPKPNFINFALFTNDLMNVQFTTRFIEEKKQLLPKQYSVVEKFQKYLNNAEQDEIVEGNEELDSENEGEKKQQQDEEVPLSYQQLKEIHMRIQELLSKDISAFEDEMEKKNDLCQELGKIGSPEKLDELARISEEVSEMHTIIENFNQVRNKVRMDLLTKKKLELNAEAVRLRMLLKRLILAEKQMDSRLPILGKKTEIFRMLDKSNLFILEGETGSGKSTQLPQLLCEYFKIFQNEKALPVLITQPRKLATRSLAERVASEMEEQVHGFVEYQASSNNRQLNPQAKIIFKLDRLVLDEMTLDPLLTNYSCLVIDEAHERTISIDVILGRVKHILERRRDFKVIVTSASLDTGLFKEYFKKEILKVEGRMFPVTEIFKPLEFIKDTKQKIERVLLEQIIQPDLSRVKDEYKGHILAFCSGIDEINSLVNTFQKKLSDKSFKILSLHGRLSAEQQRQVFHESKKTKIIFATRIAETSITINGIKVVIDPGVDRQMIYDQKSKISSMQLKTISESSAKQRAGRAGRTNSGFCFRLYSEEEKRKMKSNKTPEIQNMALDTIVLRLKSLKIDDVLHFDYLSPPDSQGLKISLQSMTIIGCLDHFGKITQIGKLLIKIPIEPFLSRSIVESIFFTIVLQNEQNDKHYKMNKEQIEKLVATDLTESTIKTLAMLINCSNLFYIKENDREDAEKKKFEEYPKMQGDFNLFLQIYTNFLSLFKERRNQELRMWANQNYISLKTLHQVREVHREINNIVRNFDFKKSQFERQIANTLNVMKRVEKADDVLLACLVPSFVTNICLYSQKSQIGYTLISQEIPIHLYGTTILSLQGQNPKWILCHDLYTNQNNTTYCKVAQKIDFNFLKLVVNEEIKQYYKIQEAEKQNPFYKLIKLELPSLVFMDILADYRKKNTYEQFDFLNKFTFLFNEGQNSIDIFYLVKKFKDLKMTSRESKLRDRVNLLREKQNDYRLGTDPEMIIQKYVKEVQEKYQKILTHPYIGQINIKLDKGFDVKSIEFTQSLYTFKVYTKGEVAELVHLLCSSLGKLNRYDEKMIFEIEGEKNREQFKRKIEVLRYYIKENGYERVYGKKECEIKCIEEIVDKRHKIPKAKLYLTFYAGLAENPNIFLNYNKYDSEMQQIYCQQMLNCLQKLSNKFERDLLFTAQISKNKNGINCRFINRVDEFDLQKILKKAYDTKILGYNFELPSSIIKFRNPEAPYCFMTDREWEEKIKQLFEKVGAEKEKISIRVWGNYKRGKDEDKDNSRHVRVNMHAQIQSFSLVLLEKFKAKYDNKKLVLGTEKIHMTYQFNQTIAAPTYDIFAALREDFAAIAELEMAKNPNVMIEASDPKKFRNVYKIFIGIRGERREDFTEPTKTLSKLFEPIQMRIEQKYNYRFQWSNRSGLLNQLETKYHFKVHFIFEKKTSILKIFCNEEIGKQIQEEIAERLQQVELKVQSISYRGKSLNAVLETIGKVKQKLKQGRILEYDISFSRRQVELTADLETLILVKNEIASILNQGKEQCVICCGIQQQPYKLLNCEHAFCMHCLVSNVLESNDCIDCPYGSSECGERISIYDIRRILSEEEFNKICDRQVGKYIEKDKRFHGCYSPDCEQIFLASETETEGSFECELCGKWYCKQCKKSHRGTFCGSQKLNLQKLGIKQCPKCKTGITKISGCNHMTCGSCKSHICWICLKLFEGQKSCYDHLVKEHDGIFDRNYIPTDGEMRLGLQI